MGTPSEYPQNHDRREGGRDVGEKVKRVRLPPRNKSLIKFIPEGKNGDEPQCQKCGIVGIDCSMEMAGRSEYEPPENNILAKVCNLIYLNELHLRQVYIVD